MTSFALAPYPLSRDFRARLDRLAGEHVDVIALTELRRLGPAGLARRLRRLHGHCYLPIENGHGVALLPVLELLAVSSRASSIETVDPNMASGRISRSRALLSPVHLVAASLDGQRALVRARRTVGRLLEAPRLELAVAPERLILHLNGNRWFGLVAGGSVAHTTGVANGFAAAGYDVEVAAASVPSGLAETVSSVQLRSGAGVGLPAEVNLYRWDESLLRQLAGRRAPSFLYQRHTLASVAGVLMSRRLRRPLVLEYNGPEVWIARHWGSRPLRYEELALSAEQASLRHAALVVTTSVALRDELVARGVERERIVWYPCGVDPDRFDPARFDSGERARLRARYGIPPDATLATFVGTFGAWHGAEVLARAIVCSSEQHRGGPARGRLHLLLVGDGPTLPEVRRLLERHGDVVTFAGLVPQAEAPLHLAASDVLVSPNVPNLDGSPFFGSPMKLFEYMAAGKAIVASDLDQVGDVLRNDGAPIGVLVEPGEPEQLAGALLRLATDPEERSRLGEAARRAAVARYTWHHHVATVLEGVAQLA